jgi:nicotinamide riboside transporter PnuC
MSFFDILTWVLAAVSLVGVWLNIRKDKRCFYLWIGANTGWIFIDIKADLIAQALLFGVYTVLSVYGLYIWGKEEKEKKTGEKT